VRHANVYGVSVPKTEGRAGMAAIVVDSGFDLRSFRSYLTTRLPAYARPVFVRVRDEIEVTGTFKYSKTELVRQGFDPANTTDLLYVDSLEAQSFIPLDADVLSRIEEGKIRL